MGMTRRLSLIALLALLVVAAPASAKVVHYKNFHSPSGMIGCFALKYGGKGLECFAPYLPPGKYGTDPYYGLEPHGHAIVAERGDYPGYPHPKDKTLEYGDTWKRHGIRCHMKQSGLTCRNKDAHGFHMAKGDLRTF
jgi:hypothetical protein